MTLDVSAHCCHDGHTTEVPVALNVGMHYHGHNREVHVPHDVTAHCCRDGHNTEVLVMLDWCTLLS